jgi:hypothetical protein
MELGLDAECAAILLQAGLPVFIAGRIVEFLIEEIMDAD